MDIQNNKEVTRLIIRAKALRQKMEAGSIPPFELYELYGIYTILIQFHLLARAGQ